MRHRIAGCLPACAARVNVAGLRREAILMPGMELPKNWQGRGCEKGALKQADGTWINNGNLQVEPQRD